MAIDRRHCLKVLGGGLAAGTFFAPPVMAALDARTLFFSAMATPQGRFGLAAFDGRGAPVFEIPLPARGHGIALSPDRNLGVVFARRPGTFAAAFRMADGAVVSTIESPEGRHFYGHGVFSPDGGFLFASENAYDEERGVIGIYEVKAAFRRVGEFSSHGIGPHEIALLPDGETLVIANGGILTHPETGRAKLNLPTMSPSLAYIDSRDGTLLGDWRLDPPLHRLSIRHLAVGRRGVAFVMQHEGPSGSIVPLIGLHNFGAHGGKETLRLLIAPADVQAHMRNYCGSACLDAAGEILGVSSPRGGITTFWDFASGDFLEFMEVPDGCGVAALGANGGFLVTSGLGGAASYSVEDARAEALRSAYLSGARWDNHLTQGRFPGA